MVISVHTPVHLRAAMVIVTPEMEPAHVRAASGVPIATKVSPLLTVFIQSQSQY